MDKYKLEYNPEASKQPELVIFSDKTQSFAGNYTIEFIKTVNNFKVYFSVNLPDNENDHEFRKVFMKTVIDCGKIFSGIYANPFVRYAVGTALSSAQFELKMPMKPVSSCLTIFNTQILNSKAFRAFTDL